MLDSRVDSLPESTLVETIKSNQLTIEQLKNQQLIGGDSQKTKLTVSSNTWDIDSTAGQFSYARWRITFVPSNIPNAFTQPLLESSVPFDNFGAGIRNGYFDIYPDPFYITQDGNVYFILEFTNNGFYNPATFKAKLGFISIDTGTFNITRLADY